MKKKTVLIIVALAIGISFWGGLKCHKESSNWDGIGKPLLKQQELYLRSNDKTWYLVSKRWGLTGDHSVVALTKTKPQDLNWEPDEANDIVWNTELSSIFYQMTKDSIKIWTYYKPSKPNDFHLNKTVRLIEVSNAQFDSMQTLINSSIKSFE